MGCYDTFIGKQGAVQLKCGPCDMRNYQIDDNVGSEYADGLYVGYEGIVVIVDGRFVALFPSQLTDKWGGIIEINLNQELDARNPIRTALDLSETGGQPI